MLESGVVPEPDDAPSTFETLKMLREDGRVIDLPMSAVALKNEMAEASTLRKEGDERYKLAKRQLAAMLGTASYGILPNDEGGVKFMTIERDGYTVEPTAFRDLAVHQRVNKKFLLAADRPERPAAPPPDPALI
jgi:hypothetical protein